MVWETPSFVEIKMDSEVNSYQDDLGEIPDVEESPEDARLAPHHS